MNTATLNLLGYCVASAYVLVPALLLLLCNALAWLLAFTPSDDHDDASTVNLVALRDEYSSLAVAYLVRARWYGLAGDYMRAVQSAEVASDYRRRAERYDALAHCMTV